MNTQSVNRPPKGGGKLGLIFTPCSTSSTGLASEYTFLNEKGREL